MIDVPADMDSVVRRWYPIGTDDIANARRAVPRGVYLSGVGGSGVSAVEKELAVAADGVLEWAHDVTTAAVVVYVLDASAPLGRDALAELAPALESTTVAVVINKIDAHRDWREVRRSVSAVISDRVPRAVDVSLWPTSAKLAECSRTSADRDVRASLADESGIDALGAFVCSAMVQSDRAVRERKYNAAVRAAAAGARREIVNKARAVTSTSTTAGLRAERARLADSRDRGRTDRAATLRSRLQLARAETMHEINEAIRQFTSDARESVDTASRAELSQLPAHLTRLLERASDGVESSLATRLRSIDADLGLGAEVPGRVDARTVVEEPASRRRSMEDRIMIFVGASAGVGLGRIAVSPLSMVPALAIAVMPVSLILGALAAWWLVRARSLVADRVHVRTWAYERAGSAKSLWEQSALARILAAETAFAQAEGETSRAMAISAETELGRVEAALRGAAQHRAAVLAACDRDLASLDRGIEKFDVSDPAGVHPKSFGPRVEPTRSAARLNR